MIWKEYGLQAGGQAMPEGLSWWKTLRALLIAINGAQAEWEAVTYFHNSTSSKAKFKEKNEEDWGRF